MTNLETLASAAVLALVPGDAALDRALAAIRRDCAAERVLHVSTIVEHVDEAACRAKGVLVRGTFQVSADCDAAGYAFDAFVSFRTLEAVVDDIVLDCEDLLSFAA